MAIASLLISSKFAPPRLGRKSIRRQHLLERLREAIHCRLVVICGSAGFGKTTLLVQWRQELLKEGAEVSWLALGPGEARLREFWSYLASALCRIGIASQDDVLLLATSPDESRLEAVAASVVNAAAEVRKELFAVIDDYHCAEDPRIHELLYFLVSQAPDNLHFILASRSPPPLLTGRLRGLGQMAEITADDLPFDAREVAEFMTANVAAPLKPEDARLIYERSLGWPAALQLLAIGLERSPKSRASLQALTDRASDLGLYLEEDVIRHLAADLVEFLEAVSICRRFDTELAAEVTGRADATELLERIETENLFLSRIELEEGRDWFRLHPLFTDFLATRRRRHGPTWERDIHLRASRWFARYGLVPEAVRHAKLAGDPAFATEVVTGAATGLRSLAHLGTLLRWIEDLAPETVRSNPKLLAIGCWALALTGRPDEAETWAGWLAATGAAEDAEIAFQLALIRAAGALAKDDTERVEACLTSVGDSLPRDSFLASITVIALTLCHAAAGRIDEARRLHHRWQSRTSAEPVSDHAIIAAASLLSVFLAEGDVGQVEREGSALLAQAEAAYGPSSTCASICAALLASAHWECDRIAEARELLVRRTKMLQLATPEVMIQATLTLARLQLLDEDVHAALATLAGEEHRFRERGLDRAVALMLAAQAAIHIGRGDVLRAAQIQTGLDSLARRNADAAGWRGEVRAIAALASARLALADHRPEDALRQLDAVREDAGRRNRRRTLVVVDLLASTAYVQLGHSGDATRLVGSALSQARSLGLLRTVIDESGALRSELMNLAAQRESATGDYPARIVAAIDRREAPASLGEEKPVAAGKRADVGITDREAAILALVAQSMSNKRIALTLNLTVDTVKWNLRNVYAKIGVSSRYDAMVWARRNGVI